MAVSVLTTESFEEKVLQSKGVCLVDFYATWCGPCKMMDPLFEEVSEELKEVSFYKMDTEEAIDIAMKYKITHVPTFLVFKDGEMVTKHTGTLTKDQIAELVK